MKQFNELQRTLKDSKTFHKLGMDMAQYYFSKSQENLNKPMPWGDETESSNRKPTIITDKGLLLLSGVPPYWDSDTRVMFRYDMEYAQDIEYGSDPKQVSVQIIQKWVKRKLGVKGRGSWRFAKNIVAKIAKDGIPPHPYIRPAQEDLIRKFKLTAKTV